MSEWWRASSDRCRPSTRLSRNVSGHVVDPRDGAGSLLAWLGRNGVAHVCQRETHGVESTFRERATGIGDARGSVSREHYLRQPMRFEHYVGIDYSGAETATSSLRGLRVYVAERESPPEEVPPPPSRKKYWTRRGIAEWLVTRLGDTPTALVGIDHGFSFPLRYFETHRLAPDWASFLDDFPQHWPTDGDHVYVDFVRNGSVGNGAARGGRRRWRRLTEERAGSAKSVFHFDVQGQVAKSTHAGIPWLRYLRREVGGQVHFWPFDGWDIPDGRSAVAEVYPSLWSGSFTRNGRTADQHDAYSGAEWLRRADRGGTLEEFLQPSLKPAERTVAEVEGWILGVR